MIAPTMIVGARACPFILGRLLLYVLHKKKGAVFTDLIERRRTPWKI